MKSFMAAAREMPTQGALKAIQAGEPVKPIGEVCRSTNLDQFLENPEHELRVSYSLPETESTRYVSDKTTGIELDSLDVQLVGKTAGLGYKRKNQESNLELQHGKMKKAKTLAEKRDLLQAEVMKYGVAAIEKMYPRQAFYQQRPQQEIAKKIHPVVRPSPIKMKPKPLGLDFEEVDARKILKPMSHAKYIKDPDYDCMVYISRREGLVPLSSLCKETATTVMSSSVRLLKGRNVRLGKPRVFVKDNGRMVAIGGSRNQHGFGIKVVKAPKLVKILPMERMVPFEMDSEYASFVVTAIPSNLRDLLPKKVDIRTIKRIQRQEALEHKELKVVLAEENRSITNHLMEKLGIAAEDEEEEPEKTAEKPKEVRKEIQNPIVELDDDDSEEEVTFKEYGVKPSESVHNPWSDEGPKSLMPIDMVDDKPTITDEFKKLMELKKGTNCLSGVDVCDVPDCYCVTEESCMATSKANTGTATPQQSSGSATPKENKKVNNTTKTARNLKKVKRALKTLGVNFLHFDDADEVEKAPVDQVLNACDKEYCKMGCICDSIGGKTIAPTHCGKVECMFDCNCSKDALKLTNNPDNKIGIAAEGLRSSSFRRLAQEELKFSNTVVASGLDLLMIGSTAGRQKRERKVPSRYQDTDAFFDSATGLPATSAQKAAAVLLLEENTTVLPVNNAKSMTRRLTQEGLKHERIKKCAVIMPRLDINEDSIKVWCMFHNQYECPCSKYKSPLEYGPDLNASRNVARRTLGNKFISRKKDDDFIEIIDDEPDIKDPEKEMCSMYFHQPDNHCARTYGHFVRAWSKKPITKFPHKIVQVVKGNKKVNESSSELKITSVSSLTNIINPKPVTLTIDSFKDFKLAIKPKGSFIFVHWTIVRNMIKFGHVIVWAFTRSKQLVMFLAERSQIPYVADAVNIHKVAVADHSHPMFDRLRNLPENLGPKASHLVLIYNGLAWEVSGFALRDVGKTVAIETPSKTSTGFSRVFYPSENGLKETTTTLKKQEAVRDFPVDPTASVQKLPRGQNMVTMTRPGQPTIQVKLPVTELTQYWCTIRVDEKVPSVKCPDSSLSLKVEVLYQAAVLAKQEKTTVRIPIQVSGEVDNFGVYAVPGLQTHVFVGPFTVKTDCSADNLQPETIEDDDDITCLDDEERVKEQAITKPIPPPEIDHAYIKQTAVMGQVPQVVAKTDEAEDISDEPNNDITNVDLHPKRVEPQYLNLPNNPHGRVVFNPDPRRADFYEKGQDSRLLWIEVPLFGRARVFVAGAGMVSFMHPVFRDHEVKCANLNAAKLWLETYFEEKRDKTMLNENDNETREKTPEKTTTVQRSQPPPLRPISIKPLETLVDHHNNFENVDPPSPTFALPENTPKERIINGRRFVCHTIVHNGKQGVAIVFDRRHHNDMRKLYHKLNQILSSNGLRRVASCVQILSRARDECLRLQKMDDEMTSQRKELMLKRSELFKDFSSRLNWLQNPADKKAAVLALKEGLKKISDAKKANEANLKDDTCSVVRIDAQSKLFPNENEIKNARAELQSIMPTQPPSQERKRKLNPKDAAIADAAITPYSDITGLKTKGKDGKVLRPMNAFMLWAKSYRKELIAKGLDGATVSKMLAEKWRSLTQDEQRVFYGEAERLKNLHLMQFPNYKYNPKARRMGMKKSNERLEPITGGTSSYPPLSESPETQEFCVSLPDNPGDGSLISIHNITNNQDIIFQQSDSPPVLSIPDQEMVVTTIEPPIVELD